MVNRDRSPYGRTRFYSNGELSTWMIKKCKLCGRFISKFRYKLCDNCRERLRKKYKKMGNKRRYEANKEEHLIWYRKYYRTHSEYRNYLNLRRRILRRINEIQIGDYI